MALTSLRRRAEDRLQQPVEQQREADRHRASGTRPSSTRSPCAHRSVACQADRSRVSHRVVERHDRHRTASPGHRTGCTAAPSRLAEHVTVDHVDAQMCARSRTAARSADPDQVDERVAHDPPRPRPMNTRTPRACSTSTAMVIDQHACRTPAAPSARAFLSSVLSMNSSLAGQRTGRVSWGTGAVPASGRAALGADQASGSGHGTGPGSGPGSGPSSGVVDVVAAGGLGGLEHRLEGLHGAGKFGLERKSFHSSRW